MNADSMYQENILDYYRNPRHFGTLDKPTISFRDSNPSCGDIIELHIALDSEKKISDVRYSGKGCAISQAAAGMLSEYILGKHIDEALQLSKEDILEMLGIEISGMRLKCALLSLKTLKCGVYDFLGESDKIERLSEPSEMIP